LDSAGSGPCLEAEFREHGNKHLGSTEALNFLTAHKDIQTDFLVFWAHKVPRMIDISKVTIHCSVA
jgi:hypothetical protein